jgi:hypothetical protein
MLRHRSLGLPRAPDGPTRWRQQLQPPLSNGALRASLAGRAYPELAFYFCPVWASLAVCRDSGPSAAHYPSECSPVPVAASVVTLTTRRTYDYRPNSDNHYRTSGRR